MVLIPCLSSIETKASIQLEILYVGGLGPGNFSSIQAAVDAATVDATVYVFDDSAPYYEHIQIDTSIMLWGENKNTTIIDGQEYGDVISVVADGVCIHGFTLQGSGPTPMIDAGIELHANSGKIYDMIIKNNPGFSVGIYANESSNHIFYNNTIYNMGNEGIYIRGSHENQIFSNILHDNGHCAMVLDESQQNIIEYNVMYDNYASVSLWPDSVENEFCFNTLCNSSFSGIGIWQQSNNNYIHHNLFQNIEETGLLLTEAHQNKIISNIFKHCNTGIFINRSKQSIIKTNNFFDNIKHAGFYDSRFTLWWRNHWDDHSRFFLKRINGYIVVPWDPDQLIEWTNFDLLPARQPYIIEMGGMIKTL